MSVIPVTIFFSLLLAGLFVVLFAREQRQRRFASAERESLLPLADETPRTVGNESEGFPPN
jgi:cbb3-type cytochrome oxidase subunit 3